MAGTPIATTGMGDTQSIDQMFSSIYGMFGGSTGGGSSSGPNTNLFGTNLRGAGGGGSSGSQTAAPFGVSVMDPNNPNNVGLYANLANIMGQVAPALMTQGGDVTSQGLSAEQLGLQMLQTPYNTYAAIASGDPAATTRAVAGPANDLATVYSGAVGRAGGGMPGGGYRATTLAGLPQAEAAQVGQYVLNAQQGALQGMTGIAGEAAGIGQAETGTGTTLIGQGATLAQNTVAAALQKAGLNMQYGGAYTFNQVAQGLNALV